MVSANDARLDVIASEVDEYELESGEANSKATKRRAGGQMNAGMEHDLSVCAQAQTAILLPSLRKRETSAPAKSCLHGQPPRW